MEYPVYDTYTFLSYLQMTDPRGEYLNTSVIPIKQDEEHLLAPGLIAAITIGSMFIFYFTIMMIVCLGEYYQYIHGKKEKPIVTRTSSITSTSRSRNRRQRNYSYTETSASQSEPRPSSCQPEGQTVISKSHQKCDDEIVICESDDEVQVEHVTINNISVNSYDPVDLEANLTAVIDDHEISTIPLLPIRSSVFQDKDDDILCESAESDDFHKLEANV